MDLLSASFDTLAVRIERPLPCLAPRAALPVGKDVRARLQQVLVRDAPENVRHQDVGDREARLPHGRAEIGAQQAPHTMMRSCDSVRAGSRRAQIG